MVVTCPYDLCRFDTAKEAVSIPRMKKYSAIEIIADGPPGMRRQWHEFDTRSAVPNSVGC